ncbi:MAG: hypothetical protein ACTSYR_00405 [Candidatus Odinarchaeia archaeon]
MAKTIHSIYLIKKTGQCLFYKKYGVYTSDESLLSGFFSAISTIAEEFSSDNIESISFEKVKIIHESGVNFSVLALVDKEDRTEIIKNKLRSIKKEFLEKYSPNLDSWKGDMSRFKDFESKVDSIINT